MTVFVDEVFALNLLIDWLLLKTAVTLTGQRCARWRLWLAALVGAVYAVLTLLPGLRWLGSLPGRAGLFCLLCAVAFGFRRQAIRPGLWYLGVCCGFCGLAYALSVLLGKGVWLLGGTAWYAVSFRFLALLAGASYLAVWALLPKLGQHKGGELRTLTLRLGQRTCPLTALHDTGNTLRDPIGGAPVLVAEASALRKLLPELPFTEAQLQNPAALMPLLRFLRPELRPRLLPYRSVGTAGGLLLALPCVCTWPGQPKPHPILVAFSPTPVSDGGLYQALLGGMLC